MRDLLFCMFTALIVAVQCETIFFTNSPKHLIGGKNVTSYKLMVKDAEPITIIEANKEVDNDRSPYTKYHERNTNNHASDRIDINLDEGLTLPKQDLHVKLLANMGGSHHLDVENTQSMHGSLGFTVTGGPGGSEPLQNDEHERRKSDQEAENDSANANVQKVVYSPILLKKFMQEYAEKLKNADNSVKTEIQKIHEKINKLQAGENDGKGEILEFDKSIEAAEQKFNLNGYRGPYQSDRFKHQSSNSYNSNSNKDKDGWVTLEAVPWSSSSVSKWYPHGSEDTRRRPSIRPLISKPDRFPWHDDTNDEYRQKPANIDRDSRPGVYSLWTKPNPVHSEEIPRPKPYKFSESNFGNSYNKYHENDRWSNQADIITDNRQPFPSESYPSKYHDGVDRYHTTSSRFHSQDRPTESNGEWVLISTTKGRTMS